MAIRIMRKCSRCGEQKPLEEFYRSSKTKCGRERICKDCHRAEAKAAKEAKKAYNAKLPELNYPRKCKKCGEIKPLTEFIARSDVIGGRGYECKACRRAHQREYKNSRKDA